MAEDKQKQDNILIRTVRDIWAEERFKLVDQVLDAHIKYLQVQLEKPELEDRNRLLCLGRIGALRWLKGLPEVLEGNVEIEDKYEHELAKRKEELTQ